MSGLVVVHAPPEKLVVPQTVTRTLVAKTLGPRGPEGPPGPGVLVLNVGEPVPDGTPTGTVILRRD